MSDAADQQPPAAILPDEDQESNDERYSKLLRQKRSEFLDHLLRSLDMVAYCHFSYLYFLDCSLFRFLIRSAVQLNFLTPKPPKFPVQSQRRPAIVALFGSTVFCFLCHVVSAAPSAGELSNGYLHGGLIIDFIGQEGPISKWRFIFVDAAILALQLIMLSLVVLKQDQVAAGIQAEEQRTALPVQDLDSEERGEVRRHSLSPGPSDDDDDDGEPASTNRRRQRGGDSLLMSGEDPIAAGRGETEYDRERRIFELTSGEFMTAELKVVDVVRKQWRRGVAQSGEAAQSRRMTADTSSEGARRRV